ncbi:hypothetical protein P3T18_000571 [Paraburkholderia sp. GAS199]|uniref:hypothetical protein n=1 Tax=Paraburkholderia sp. GAS199 TaxID=3035126 RepID=UPI003D1E0D8B
MSTFQTYTIENAPAASKASLEDTQRAFGFVPNLQANMAESPALLAGIRRCGICSRKAR